MLSGNLSLTSSVSNVPLVGPSMAARLGKLNIRTIRDLLYYIPTRYEDFSLVSKISQIQEGEVVTIQGTVLEMKNQYTRGGFVLQRAVIEDETGIIEAMWFNQRFLVNAIKAGDKISLSGKIKRSGKKLQISTPKFEIIRSSTTTHTGRLVPIYSETAGVTSKWLRSRIMNLMDLIKSGQVLIEEYLDQNIREENSLMDLKQAVLTIHFPSNLIDAERAKQRLAFDELLTTQLVSQKRKQEWQVKTVGNKLEIDGIRDKLELFVRNLPFELTEAQRKVIDEIYRDLTKEEPMNRLLQGDVGSGKTVVAALAVLASYYNGYQSAIMAPTEILANQHYQTLTKLFAPLKLGVGIATGSKKDYQGFDVVVGTHALLTEGLNFEKLGLVVIDEQHRFGVGQRAKLTGKGKNPHVLTMTATPIPRTVALTLYGDLDLSIIDQMPKDRLPIKTWVVPKEKRQAAYEWIKGQKTQSFIICPLIEESETLVSVRSAKEEFNKLSTQVFPELKLGLIHGKLKPKEKDKVLEDFRQKKLDILVATPVVEVGIDIPSATIMMIEASERFGLAQLHQLRGRVGRGDQQSFCLLFTDDDQAQTINRLKSLETVNSGLKLAEIDLKFRGPGQRFGTEQHGRWDLSIATFDDLGLVEKTSELAKRVLESPESFPSLRKYLENSKMEGVVPN